MTELRGEYLGHGCSVACPSTVMPIPKDKLGEILSSVDVYADMATSSLPPGATGKSRTIDIPP